MNKKIKFFLFVSLLAIGTAYPQSSRISWYEGDDEEPVVTVQPTDTVVQVPETPQIQVLERTWGHDLEDYLKEKIISLSSNPSRNNISKQEIEYVYKVYQVPCKSGKQTVYLSMTSERKFILSKENPNDTDEICGCFLELQLPEKVVATPGKRQTDDESFGQPVSNGNNRKIINEF